VSVIAFNFVQRWSDERFVSRVATRKNYNNSMRRILTSALIASLLLNLQAIWGLCDHCCTIRVHALSAESSATPDCHEQQTERSFHTSQKHCSCDLPGVLSSDSSEAVNQSCAERVRSLSHSVVQSIGVRDKGPFTRSGASARGAPSPANASLASSQLPLRI
jgi:hypothetical protein